MGRVEGKVALVRGGASGYTVVFLASDESKFITGQVLQVEGGHYIANPSIADVQAWTEQQK